MVLLYNQLRGVGMDHETAWFYVRHLYAGNGIWRESTPELVQAYPHQPVVLKRSEGCRQRAQRLA